MILRRVAGVASLGALLAATQLIGRWSRDGFDHQQHRGLFPTCEACHAGINDPLEAAYPAPASCDACHDGVIEERVEYGPPAPVRTNLRFEHAIHRDTIISVGDAPVTCFECHADASSEWMTVRVAAVERCLSCHDVGTGHFDAETPCATCHVPLSEADRLSPDDVAAFPSPPTHDDPAFGGPDHGRQSSAIDPVAPACATCHARNFCIECHVDAPEQPTIQALGMDTRSLRHEATLAAPPDHELAGFERAHGDLEDVPASCATCHTQQNCWTCHVSTPDVAADLRPAEPGRASGPILERRIPADHAPGYVTNHGPTASVSPATCAGCHAREDCLDCHRPGAASAPSGYHPVGFLTEHPSASYARQTSCGDCHNVRQFCTSCHAAAGLTGVRGIIGAGYHDGNRAFSVGHGQSARQNLESCVSCHVERDCLTCHSATGGRRFNPHGPGFDADRLRRKAGQMCTACHINP